MGFRPSHASGSRPNTGPDLALLRQGVDFARRCRAEHRGLGHGWHMAELTDRVNVAERPRLFLLLLSLLLIPSSLAAGSCRKSTTIAGFESDLAMVQHQLHGVIRVLDGCSFSIREFDMLAGSAQVRWWGAAGDDIRNLTVGSPISDQTLDRTSRNESFTVRLADNATWDQIAVLAVCDPATASDFGHIIIEAPDVDQTEAPPSSADHSPGPSPSSNSFEQRSKRRIRRQPTMFDNCLTLSSSNRRIRGRVLCSERLLKPTPCQRRLGPVLG